MDKSGIHPRESVLLEMRILLVENHTDTANYLCTYLRGLGHEPISAQTLAGARAALRDSVFDLLISDISLPDGSGWDLKPDLAAIPIAAVAMSGYGTDEDRQRSLDAGFQVHLAKPFVPADLDAVLERVEQERSALVVA